jgi:hypothetical protein
MRVVRLADDGSIASVLWQLDDTDAYFLDFVASSAGVAWLASTQTSDMLFFSSDATTAPVAADARYGVPMRGTVTIANGTASLLESTDNDSSVFTLSGTQVSEQAKLAWSPMAMRTLGNALLVTSRDGVVVSSLDSTGKLLSSKTLSRPLNIPAISDARYVYLPLRDEIALFPRVENWL